MTNVVSVR